MRAKLEKGVKRSAKLERGVTRCAKVAQGETRRAEMRLSAMSMWAKGEFGAVA